jgi:uncharacterized membrane protein YfcA
LQSALVSAPRASWKIAADGLVVGVITGLVGVGGGFLIVMGIYILVRSAPDALGITL